MEWTETPPGTHAQLVRQRWEDHQAEEARLFEYARHLTAWLSQQYGIAVQVQQCRARNSYYRWHNGHIIRYSPNNLRQTCVSGYLEYASVRHCWSDSAWVCGFEAVHHTVLHEFAHVLDVEYGPRLQYGGAPTYRRSNGRRIFHGIHYQRWLTELIILVPFDEVASDWDPLEA